MDQHGTGPTRCCWNGSQLSDIQRILLAILWDIPNNSLQQQKPPLATNITVPISYMWRKHNNPNENLKSWNAGNDKVTTSRRIAHCHQSKIGPNILDSKITKKRNVNCLSYFRKVQNKIGIVNEIAKHLMMTVQKSIGINSFLSSKK